MGKVTIQDIIDLAKAGYKPSDVKELFELANTAETKDDGEGATGKVPEGQGEPKPQDKKPDEPELDAFDKLAQQDD